MYWVVFGLGIAWFIIIEYIRSQPSVPNKVAFWLTFIAPLGAMCFFVAAILIRRLH